MSIYEDGDKVLHESSPLPNNKKWRTEDAKVISDEILRIGWVSGRVISDLTSIPIDGSYNSVVTVFSDVELNFDLTDAPTENAYIELYLKIDPSVTVTVNPTFLNADILFQEDSIIKVGIAWNGVAGALFTESNKDALESSNKLFLTTTTVPADGLLAFYEFENNLNDSSGNGNTLINSNNVSFDTTSPKFGVASGSFNGVDSISEIPVNIPLSSDYSFSYWVKYPSSTIGIDTNVLSRETGIGFGGEFWSGRKIPSNDTLTFNTAGSELFTTFVPNFDSWDFIAQTYNSTTKELKIYFNGMVETFTGEDIIESTNVRIAVIGLSTFGNIDIDNLRMYSKELTSTEVEALYNEA